MGGHDCRYGLKIFIISYENTGKSREPRSWRRTASHHGNLREFGRIFCSAKNRAFRGSALQALRPRRSAPWLNPSNPLRSWHPLPWVSLSPHPSRSKSAGFATPCAVAPRHVGAGLSPATVPSAGDTLSVANFYPYPRAVPANVQGLPSNGTAARPN
jgi:hypothetical protein